MTFDDVLALGGGLVALAILIALNVLYWLVIRKLWAAAKVKNDNLEKALVVVLFLILYVPLMWWWAAWLQASRMFTGVDLINAVAFVIVLAMYLVALKVPAKWYSWLKIEASKEPNKTKAKYLMGYITAAGATMSVISTPGTAGFTIVRALIVGHPVKLYELKDGHWRIHETKEEWVYMGYIFVSHFVTVNAQGNGRSLISSPTAPYSLGRVLRQDEPLYAIGFVDGHYKIQAGSGIWYVYAEYVVPQKVGVINESGRERRMLEAPRADAQMGSSLVVNAPVIVGSLSDNHWPTMHDGKRQFIMNDYVTIVQAN